MTEWSSVKRTKRRGLKLETDFERIPLVSFCETTIDDFIENRRIIDSAIFVQTSKLAWLYMTHT